MTKTKSVFAKPIAIILSLVIAITSLSSRLHLQHPPHNPREQFPLMKAFIKKTRMPVTKLRTESKMQKNT